MTSKSLPPSFARGLLAGGLFAGAVGVCGAAPAGGAAELPKAFAPLIDQPNVHLIERFAAVGGLTGFAFQVGLEAQVFYVLPDGSTVLNGDVILEDGTVASAEDERRYAGRIDYASFWLSVRPLPDAMQPLAARALAAAAVVPLAKGEPRVFMLYDGFCGYCHLAWQKLRAQKDQPFALIPVARLNARSLNAGAALLEGSDKRFTLDLLGEAESREALLERVQSVGAESVAKLSGNNALMEQLGLQGTPTWLWVGADGKVRVHSGVVPEEALARLPAGLLTPAEAVARATPVGVAYTGSMPPEALARKVAQGLAGAAAAAAAQRFEVVPEDAVVEILDEAEEPAARK